MRHRFSGRLTRDLRELPFPNPFRSRQDMTVRDRLRGAIVLVLVSPELLSILLRRAPVPQPGCAYVRG